MKFLILILIIFSSLTSLSQDTLRMMHYNLLMYGDNYGGCTSSNNNIDDKNGYLNTIVEYVNPDILTVNEIYKTSFYHEYLKTNALNVNGVDFYEMGNPSNSSNSPIINQVFYNSQKLTKIDHFAIMTNYRDIDIYKFEYNIQGPHEPVYLNCVIAHLKAGNSSGDASERAYETGKLMDYLDNINASGNYIFSGDFNVYSSSEQAFQNLLFDPNWDIRFYDPINTLGAWNNNSYFSDAHTQSTHTSGDCFSSGGMDDRFDFILISDEIKNGTDKIDYINGSYISLGQDGNHFNKSLIASPINNSVPNDVLEALYNMSDHLPVVMDLLVEKDLGINDLKSFGLSLSFQNPAKDNIELKIKSEKNEILDFEIHSLQGKLLYSDKKEIIQGANRFSIPASNLKTGMYFLKIVKDLKILSTEKVIKL